MPEKSQNPFKISKKIPPNSVHFYTFVSFPSKTLWTLESHPKTKGAYFCKWTTSDEPPVRSGSPSDSYFGSNKPLFSDQYCE